MSATAGTAAAAAAAADVVDPNNTMTFFTDWGTQLDGYVQTVIQFVIGFVSSYWLNFRDLGNKFDRVLHAMALGIQNVDHFVVAMLETSHKSDYMLQTLRTTFQQVEQGWDDFVHSKTAKMYLPELKYMKGWKASELGLLVLILLLTVSWYHIRNERELRHAFPQTMIQYKKEYTKRKKSKQEKKKQKKNSKKGNPPSRKEEEDDPEETDAKSRTISFRITPNIQGLQFSTGTSWERRIQTLAMFSCSLAFVLPGTVVCYASVLHFGILLPLHVFILHEDDDYSTSNTDSLPPWYVMKTGWTCGLIWLYLLYSYGIDTAATTGARYPYLRSTSSTGTTTTTTKTPATVGAVVAGWWERGSHYWWSAACDFLPVVLVKTADLPATKKHVVGNLVYTLPASYVLGYHPHGIIAVGAFCAFATNGVRTIDLSNGAHGEEHHHLQTAINNYNRNATEEEVEVDQQETSSELFAAEHPPQQRPPLRLSALELLQAQVETKTNMRGFSALFPKLDRRLVTLPINFRTPFLRDYFLGMGAINSSKATFRNYLNMDLPISGERTTNPTIGRAMCVVVGGAAESLLAQENTMQLVLHKRRGFVREAIMADANLVPVLGFGTI